MSLPLPVPAPGELARWLNTAVEGAFGGLEHETHTARAHLLLVVISCGMVAVVRSLRLDSPLMRLAQRTS